MEYKILTPDDKLYPQKLKTRLGNDTPGKLYYSGKIENLNRFTFGMLASSEYSGIHLTGMFHPSKVFEKYEMNYISGFMSGLEFEIFRLALRRRHATLTLFTEKGLGKETFDSFFNERFPKPFDSWWGKDEYFRQAKESELLIFSIVDPELNRMEKHNIIERNFLSGVLSDIVFVPYAYKGTKTYSVVKRLLEIKVPVFTIICEDKNENKDLYELGIPAYGKEIQAVLEQMGAKLPDPEKALTMDINHKEKIFTKNDDTQMLMGF